MRKSFGDGARCAILVVTVSVSGVFAQQHQHQAPPAGGEKPAETQKPAETRKKDPNRKKPENQPGKVMNAEALAASHAGHHEMEALPDGGVLPQGWKHRFDLPTMKLEHVMLHSMGDSLHVKTGPPGIFYDPQRTASGLYSVKATFTQLAKGEHREGYGPFIGGADLEGPEQRYTYFLLRQDGKFLIKQRLGVNTKGIVDWTAHPAIKTFDADGRMSNELAVVVEQDAVRFLINGTEVARQPRTELETDGVVGLRINHQLNVQVDGLGVAPAATDASVRPD